MQTDHSPLSHLLDTNAVATHLLAAGIVVGPAVASEAAAVLRRLAPAFPQHATTPPGDTCKRLADEERPSRHG